MLHRSSTTKPSVRATTVLATVAFILIALSQCHLEEESTDPLNYEQAPRTLATTLIRDLRASKAESVAFFDLTTPDGERLVLGSWLADELVSILIPMPDRPALVERKHLNRALEEQDLLATGRFNSESAARAGLLRGAHVVVIGNITVTKQVVLVEVRALSPVTGEIVSAPSVQLRRATIPPRLLLPTSSSEDNHLSRQDANSHIQSSRQVGNLRIDVLTIRRQPDRKRATVELRLINTSNEPIHLGIRSMDFGRCSINLRDENGASHPPLGDDRGSGIINCVAKTAKKEDFSILLPGSNPIGLTFKAREGERIEGDRFKMNISFILFTQEGLLRYPVGFEDLDLSE